MTATTSPDLVEERREVPDSIQLGIWEWEGGQQHEHEPGLTARGLCRSASTQQNLDRHDQC